ncbi:MAG: nitroreductase family deazaflavin-dependent oxidoreductase [Acidimicrobiales bacterium]
MPSDLTLKAMNTLHRAVQRASFGKVGWKAGSMPVVELTTIGRKSGARRTVLLTSPVQEGDAYVVVASRGGDDQHPAWFLNLRDNPAVEVSTDGASTRPMHARIADTDERARLWPRITADYKNYANYQTKTDREIPLVFLEPPA